MSKISHGRENLPTVFFVFIAGGSTAHLENMKVQRESCFSQLPINIKCLWVIADPAIQELKEIDSVLYVPIEDLYSNLLLKTQIAFNWVIANYSPDFLIRSNTSNFFNLAMTNSIFENWDPNEKIYAGATGKFRILGNSQSREVEYVSGSGIFLTQKVARLISSIDVKSYEEIVEDVAIGDFLSQHDVFPTPLFRNNLTDWEPLKYCFQIRVKAWHSDKLTIRRFRFIARIFKSNPNFTSFYFLWFEFLESIEALRKLRVRESIQLISKAFPAAIDFLKLKKSF